MKSLFKVSIAATALLLALLVSTAHSASTTFSVDEFLEMGEETLDSVSVMGIVGQPFPSNNWFNLIDLEKFRACGSITCGQAALPVLWEGEMPPLKSKVIIIGEATEKAGRLMFEANEIEVME